MVDKPRCFAFAEWQATQRFSRKADKRDSIRSKVFEGGGMGFWEGEEGPFWRKGLPPSSKPPPSFPKDFWPVGGAAPRTRARESGIRHAQAFRQNRSCANMLLFHQNNRVSFFKKRVGEPKHVRKPFHTFPRYFSLPAHPTKQSYPAGPSPYGKVATGHPPPPQPSSPLLHHNPKLRKH